MLSPVELSTKLRENLQCPQKASCRVLLRAISRICVDSSSPLSTVSTKFPPTGQFHCPTKQWNSLSTSCWCVIFQILPLKIKFLFPAINWCALWSRVMKTLDSARVRGGRGVKRRGPPIAGAGGGQTMEQGPATLHLAIPRMLLLLLHTR